MNTRYVLPRVPSEITAAWLDEQLARLYGPHEPRRGAEYAATRMLLVLKMSALLVKGRSQNRTGPVQESVLATLAAVEQSLPNVFSREVLTSAVQRLQL